MEETGDPTTTTTTTTTTTGRDSGGDDERGVAYGNSRGGDGARRVLRPSLPRGADEAHRRRFQFVDVLSALRPGFRPLYNHPLQAGEGRDRATACLEKLLQLPADRRIEAAALLDQAWCIEELFMRGAPCNTRNNAKGYTPLHIAASQNNLHCIEVLLNMQPYYDATVLTNKGYSSHYLAKACKALPAVQLMLMDLDDPHLNSRPPTPSPAQDHAGRGDGIPIGAALWARLAEGRVGSSDRRLLPFVAVARGAVAPQEAKKDISGAATNDSEPDDPDDDGFEAIENCWFEFEPHSVQDYLAARHLVRELGPSSTAGVTGAHAVSEFWPGRVEDLLSSKTFLTMVHFMAEMVLPAKFGFPVAHSELREIWAGRRC